MNEEQILQKAKDWAVNPYFEASFREEIQKLLESPSQKKQLIDSFYKDLEFGTGGIRGVVGPGTNRMNLYNLKKVTQGLSNYITNHAPKNAWVVIGHDSRLSSPHFAKATAEVLAANQIGVYFFDSPHPTPLVSFAIRYYNATAGVVITASHNPPEYNGYKVSWSDGAQITFPQDKGIIDQIYALHDFTSIKTLNFSTALEQGKIKKIGKEVDEAYFLEVEKILNLFLGGSKIPKVEEMAPHILYTPLHGVGGGFVAQLFGRNGLKNYQPVKTQFQPDGNFPTLLSPNPENASAFEEAKKVANQNSLAILATDPDADRLGVLCRVKTAKNRSFQIEPIAADGWVKLTGNQIGQILLYTYCQNLQAHQALPKNSFFVSTIVSSPLGAKIAEHFGVKAYETLTGFKNINHVLAEKKAEQQNYLFAYEESFGYQFGDFLREKDGLSASLMFAAVLGLQEAKGKDVLAIVEEIYQKFGFHCDQMVDAVLPGSDGAQKIQGLMKKLRTFPPQKIAGQKVILFRDYLSLEEKKGEGVQKLPADLKADVLSFTLQNNTRITARPSGTEPKIKFYFHFSALKKEDLQGFASSCAGEFLKNLGL